MSDAARDLWRRTVTGAWYTGAWSRDTARLPPLDETLSRMFGDGRAAPKGRGIISGIRSYYTSVGL